MDFVCNLVFPESLAISWSVTSKQKHRKLASASQIAQDFKASIGSISLTSAKSLGTVFLKTRASGSMVTI